MKDRICNICRTASWAHMGGRQFVRCRACGSLERTRVIKLFLDKAGVPKAGAKVLHFAPEKGLYEMFTKRGDLNYRAVDFSPENFPFAQVDKFDLCSDASALPNREYDIILHSHVFEHIPCNITAVLYHLHRALKDDGYHIMCVPFLGSSYEEDLGPLSGTQARQRFGQNDHVRKFGTDDFDRTLGMVFNIKPNYSLTDYFSKEDLILYNIPEDQWNGYNLSSVFLLRKEDLKLRE